MLERDGVIVGVAQVVLASPGDLDRRAAHRLGQDGGLQHEVGLGLAPEATAEERDIDRHVLHRHPESLGDEVTRGLR